MKYIFTPQPIPTVPVAGSDAMFPVHRIYCVGRNYAEHAKEMGHDSTKEPPFFFQKNADSIVVDGKLPYPAATNDFHHELELVVALKSGGTNISAKDALDQVFGYAVGLDMTRRDLQNQAKKAGRPWEVAKAFDRAAPISAIAPAATIGHPARGQLKLDVNGTRRQTGDLADMIWDVAHQIEFLSGLFELCAGDLIFSGTPSGVAAVVRGDRLHGTVEGVGELSVTVV